ncbi:peptidylprolyl isomerase [uncultured Sphingomonas sp.]|uniref:peptidylprolyl isomerase n=1 Tax=uncultured Sphingomonas sp. TaxID=158754 RepID=UPI0026174953|nr:peptidylprolyl isomerase [uncultured Sphingomonas sp.]
MFLLAALLIQATALPAPMPAAPTSALVLQAAATAPLPPPAPGMVRVALVTDTGRIVLDLEQARAPITTANFLRYVDGHRLNGTVFYRAAKGGPRFGFIQFGVQNAPKRVLPPIAHEPSTQTGVTHTDGAISVARNEPGSARGDFTINLGDQPSLDADPVRPGDNLGYAAFGHVVQGLDVVEHIFDAPIVDGGFFPGEMLAQPVRIVSARRVLP